MKDQGSTPTYAVKATTRTSMPTAADTLPAATHTLAPSATPTAAAQLCSDLLPTQADPAQMVAWFDCAIRSGSRALFLSTVVKTDIVYAPGNTDCDGPGECYPKFSAADTVDAILIAVKEGQPGCMGYSTANGLSIVYQGLAFDRTSFAKNFLGAGYVFSFGADAASPVGYQLGTIITVQPGIGIIADQIPYACSLAAQAAPTSQNPPSAGQNTLDVNAASGWTATGMTLQKGWRVEITAQGSWSNGNYQRSDGSTFRASYGPEGYIGNKDTSGNVPVPSTWVGALIGRIGDNPAFAIGPDLTAIAANGGPLSLAMNDAPDSLTDNQGKLTVAIKVQSTVSPTPFPCAGTLPSRLAANGEAFVSLDPPLPNRLRRSPGMGSLVLGQIDPGTTVKLVEQPKCMDNMIWWKIHVISTGQEAWTAEGDSQGYWLAPCTTSTKCGN